MTKGCHPGYIPVRRIQTTTFQRKVTTQLSTPVTGEQSIDSYFGSEFTNLENELQNEQTKHDSKTNISINSEQTEVQKAATGITKVVILFLRFHLPQNKSLDLNYNLSL